MKKVFPYHPNSLPVESLMKSLGKNEDHQAFHQGKRAEEALREFLSAYRATPHISTGISPGDFMMV